MTIDAHDLANLTHLSAKESNALLIASFLTSTALVQGVLWLVNSSTVHAAVAAVATIIAPLAWQARRRARTARVALLRRLRENIYGAGA